MIPPLSGLPSPFPNCPGLPGNLYPPLDDVPPCINHAALVLPSFPPFLPAELMTARLTCCPKLRPDWFRRRSQQQQLTNNPLEQQAALLLS